MTGKLWPVTHVRQEDDCMPIFRPRVAANSSISTTSISQKSLAVSLRDQFSIKKNSSAVVWIKFCHLTLVTLMNCVTSATSDPNVTCISHGRDHFRSPPTFPLFHREFAQVVKNKQAGENHGCWLLSWVNEIGWAGWIYGWESAIFFGSWAVSFNNH